MLAPLCVAATAAAARAVTVSLKGLGDVEGVAEGNYSYFRGIPYAAPPVGDNRWRPPQPAAPWGPKGQKWDATRFRHNCMQYGGFDPPQPPDTLSEDCLYLNVYAPPPPLGAGPLPVLFWVHGGGFRGGGGNESRLDGTWDVALTGRVVIVTINYRLNVFGFAASDALRARDPAGGTGNYGILDQRAALQWVQDHISAFGGDRSRVFLVGESAGAASVSQHLVRKGSWGLFARAGMESGAFLGGATTVADVEPEFAKLARRAKCARDTVACLVGLPATELLTAYTSSGARLGSPLVDGVDLLAAPPLLGMQGQLAPGVQVLAGSVREDLGGARLSQHATQADFEKAYAGRGFDTSTLAAIYSDEEAIGGYSKWYWAAVHAGADEVMGCPARRVCGWYEAEGAYRYWFTHVPQGPTGAFPGLCHHACEIPFVFHVNTPMNGEKSGDEFILPGEYELSAAMVNYWVNFAASGDPNQPAAPAVPWPRHSNVTGAALNIGDAPNAVDALKKARCDFWDAHQQSADRMPTELVW